MPHVTRSLVDESKSPIRTVLLLAWPILLEQVLVSLVQAVDTAMVGSLGAVATASVSISSSPNMMVNNMVMSLGVGFTALVARSVGAGDLERARGLLRQAILTVFSLGIPLSMLMFFLARWIPVWMGGAPEILDLAQSYNRILALSMVFRCMTMMLTSLFRGYGDSRTPMRINVMVNLMNVAGNYLMIFPTRQVRLLGLEFTMPGLGWGVAGAAASTSLSATVGSLCLLAICFLRKGDMQISLRESFAPHWDELRTVGRLSLPVMFQRLAMNSAGVLVTSTVASLGTAAVAAQSLSGTAESLSFMPGFAYSSAITTLYGQALGAKKPRMAHTYLMKTLQLSALTMSAMTVILFTFSRQIMGIFTPDLQVIELGRVLLQIVALIQVPQGIAFCISGALQGAGDTRSPLWISLISIWGVRVLGSLLCVRVLHMGLYAVSVAMCTDNVVRCVLFVLRYRKQRHRLAELRL